jgi:hypothetical protein
MGYKFVNVSVGKPALTDFIFLFLSGGYKPQFWFWQALIMVRKMALVLVVVFLADETEGELQSYCGMWVMFVALVLQLWLQPSEKKEHNDVEAMSLGIITLTLNLSLVYFWPGLPNWVSIAITIALFLFNVLAALALLRFIYQPLIDLFSEGVIAGREVLRKIQAVLSNVLGKGDKRRVAFKVHRSAVSKRATLEDDEGPPESAAEARQTFFHLNSMGDDVAFDFDELDAMTAQLQTINLQRANAHADY